MNKILYKPKIQVLYIEGDKKIYETFTENLLNKSIYVYRVNNLEEALKVLKLCSVDLIVASRKFVFETSISKYEKKIIYWPNSTTINEMADIVEDKIIELSGFKKTVSKYKFEEYYKEPATILGTFMAFDMRAQMFKGSAGRNYGPLVAEINNGMLRILIDPSDDKKIAVSIFNKILKKNFFPKIKREVNSRAEKLIFFSRALRKKDFSKYSNKKLAELYLRFTELFMQMRMYSSLPTAMEHETNMWTEYLKKILEKKISNQEEYNKVFSTLTTPEKYSYVNEYETEVAKLGVKKYLREDISEEVKKLSEKYAWIAYTFEGTPITEKDVYEKIDILGKTSEDFAEFLGGNKERPRQIRLLKKVFEKKHKLTKQEFKMFEIGADIVFIKFFRKGIFAESYYSIEFLLSEIGKRIGCSVHQVSNMFAYEVLAALKTGNFPSKLIDLRVKESIFLTDKKQSSSFSTKVKNFYSVRLQEIIAGDLKGQIAFSGKVTGRVSIINSVEDMKKMKDGDVLVSRSTNPSLVPAMRQSSAFVTDAGGLTCHAAIVAREMKKPCIVGTKFATKVLKDGDLVEVDANKGIVRIISNK